MKTKSKNAVIYARVSSKTDRQGTSRQVYDLHQYAEANHYEVLNTFEEKISGAVCNSERRVFIECIEFCEQEKISTLLVSELSRLGRNTMEVLKAIEQLTSKGINVYLQKERLNTLNENGEMNFVTPVILSCLGMAAQLERENIFYRLQSGREQYIRNGGKLGRRVGSGENAEQFLEKHKGVLKQLRKGKSIRDVAKLEEVATATVQKVKRVAKESGKL